MAVAVASGRFFEVVGVNVFRPLNVVLVATWAADLAKAIDDTVNEVSVDSMLDVLRKGCVSMLAVSVTSAVFGCLETMVIIPDTATAVAPGAAFAAEEVKEIVVAVLFVSSFVTVMWKLNFLGLPLALEDVWMSCVNVCVAVMSSAAGSTRCCSGCCAGCKRSTPSRSVMRRFVTVAAAVWMREEQD